MEKKEIMQYRLVCDCGYGQRGERYEGDPEARTWDGRTVVAVVAGQPLTCPNCGAEE